MQHSISITNTLDENMLPKEYNEMIDCHASKCASIDIRHIVRVYSPIKCALVLINLIITVALSGHG